MMVLFCKNYIFISILQIGQTVLITGEPGVPYFFETMQDPNTAGTFERKLQFYFILHFTDWADGVAYGVDHRRTLVV